MLVVRDQALIAQLFDVGIADNNEDADVAFFKCVVFHKEDAITTVEGPLRATAFLILKVIKTMTFFVLLKLFDSISSKSILLFAQ